MISFCFHKCFLAEINHEIHDRELLVIVDVLKNGVIYSKEFNMKSSCILITIVFSISWLFVFWINVKLDGHYFCLYFIFSSHIIMGTNKGNHMLSHCSYLVLKEEVETSYQQCDVCHPQVQTSSILNIMGNCWWQNFSLSNS